MAAIALVLAVASGCDSNRKVAVSSFRTNDFVGPKGEELIADGKRITLLPPGGEGAVHRLLILEGEKNGADYVAHKLAPVAREDDEPVGAPCEGGMRYEWGERSSSISFTTSGSPTCDAFAISFRSKKGIASEERAKAELACAVAERCVCDTSDIFRKLHPAEENKFAPTCEQSGRLEEIGLLEPYVCARIIEDTVNAAHQMSVPVPAACERATGA